MAIFLAGGMALGLLVDFSWSGVVYGYLIGFLVYLLVAM